MNTRDTIDFQNLSKREVSIIIDLIIYSLQNNAEIDMADDFVEDGHPVEYNADDLDQFIGTFRRDYTIDVVDIVSPIRKEYSEYNAAHCSPNDRMAGTSAPGDGGTIKGGTSEQPNVGPEDDDEEDWEDEEDSEDADEYGDDNTKVCSTFGEYEYRLPRKVFNNLTNQDIAVLEQAPGYDHCVVLKITKRHWDHLQKKLHLRCNGHHEYEFFYKLKEGNFCAVEPLDDDKYREIVLWVDDDDSRAENCLFNDVFKSTVNPDIFGLARFLDYNIGGSMDEVHMDIASLIIFG